MVAEASNTTVSVLRGTGTDQFGDTVDLNLPVLTGLPAVLTETARTTQDPSSATPRTIRAVECHLPAWAEVVSTDRIYDESTGNTYMIIGVTAPPTLIGAPVDLLLDLKRVTASTT